MKRFLALCLVSTTLLGTCVFGADATRFVCDGKEAAITATAIFRDGYTYLPVAQVCKALGYHVIEKTSNNSVTAEVRGESGYFSVFLGKQSGRMNGQDIHLGKAPFSENGVIYVSSTLIEEQLGVNVNYESAKNTIYINSAGEGKITSTVGQVPVAAPSTGTSQSSSTTSTTTVSQTIDFGAITGRTCTSSSNGRYVYEGADNDDARKYVRTLEGYGYTSNYRPGGQLFVASDIYELTKGSSKITVTVTSEVSYGSSSYLTGQSSSTSGLTSTSTTTVVFE